MKYIKTLTVFIVIIISLFLISCGGKEKMTTATFETSMGNFKIELFTEEMPITTQNFIDLANNGFYDGVKFHRIIAGFMIQGGDPLSKEEAQRTRWGTGGPGYTIKDEFSSVGNNKGTIAMANAGPNTGGSQFFINLVNNNFLDNKHPVFGEVIEGLDVVEKIGVTPTRPGDQPVEDVVIEKVTIE